MFSTRSSCLRFAAFKYFPYLTHRSCLIHQRSLSVVASRISSRQRVRLSRFAIAGTILGGSILVASTRPIRADAERDDEELRNDQIPLSELIRAYTVYSMCSIPWLVDYSPKILSTLLTVPGLSLITEKFVRYTFFNQFVGGDTALEVLPVLRRLRSEDKGTLFAYSVEVDENEAAGSKSSSHAQPAYKQAVNEMIRCIEVAADFEDQIRLGQKSSNGRRTWVAVKMTALLPDAQSLINFSKYLLQVRAPTEIPVCYPGCPRSDDCDVLEMDPVKLPETCSLTAEDLNSLKELKEDLYRICQRAKERGVKLIIDAEYTWYQPAVDAFQLDLMRKFNSLPKKTNRLFSQHAEDINPVQPLIYGTFQAYLRRMPEYLEQSLIYAKAGNYALGVKLVRGAYHVQENAVYEKHFEAQKKAGGNSGKGKVVTPSKNYFSEEPNPPVWSTKAETDLCYNTCVKMLIGSVAQDVGFVGKDRSVKSSSGVRPPHVGILFGTHNSASCDLVLDSLVKYGLAKVESDGGRDVIHIDNEVAGRVTFGQLYGMSDSLSDSLVKRTRTEAPFVIKYVPYGALSEVLPYLGRRAIENKSVLGNGVAEEERRRAGSEIVRRFYGIFRS